jgi:hypothetical protein
LGLNDKKNVRILRKTHLRERIIVCPEKYPAKYNVRTANSAAIVIR